MRKEDRTDLGTVNQRINDILDCGFRYAKYKLCLRRNRRKSDPRFMTYGELLERLKDEVKELEEVMNQKGFLNTSELRPEAQMIEYVAQEAGDIINFASMICDKTEEVV
jgi:HEPN domain-containing protein